MLGMMTRRVFAQGDTNIRKYPIFAKLNDTSPLPSTESLQYLRMNVQGLGVYWKSLIMDKMVEILFAVVTNVTAVLGTASSPVILAITACKLALITM